MLEGRFARWGELIAAEHCGMFSAIFDDRYAILL
jgi:hypothetical protein